MSAAMKVISRNADMTSSKLGIERSPQIGCNSCFFIVMCLINLSPQILREDKLKRNSQFVKDKIYPAQAFFQRFN